MGTVGCVALDCNGNLASANSTGGITNRLPGRVSDTSIIGAGCWAENGVVAIAATGTGDQFIAGVIAYDLAALMKYKALDLKTAANTALERLKELGGSGGFALVDGQGNIHLPFNFLGMFRSWWNNSGEAGEAVYLDE
jgi:beta-aspartyl-peptidase (threonine type)